MGIVREGIVASQIGMSKAVFTKMRVVLHVLFRHGYVKNERITEMRNGLKDLEDLHLNCRVFFHHMFKMMDRFHQ